MTLLLLTGISCKATHDAEVREYLRLAVALGERDPDSIDYDYIKSWAQPNWLGDVKAKPPTFAAIRDSARRLAERVHDSPRLARQLQAIATRADVLAGAKVTFEREAQGYFGVDIRPGALLRTNFSDLRPYHSKLVRLLPGKGTLAERYAAFDERFLIPPERLPAVFSRALEGCRAQTLAHLKLPEGEGVRVEYVHNRPWSGFSRYQGKFHSLIEINVDLGLTVDRALQLACHEGYPGHHAVNVLQDIRFVEAGHSMDWLVQPTFSPQSLVSEGLATYAVQMAFPGEERTRFERDELFPLAGLDPGLADGYDKVERLVDQLDGLLPVIARDFLDGKLEWARAAAALEEQALMAHPEETLKYLNEFRSYVVTYTIGKDLVAKRVNGDWKKFEELILNPDAASVIISK